MPLARSSGVFAVASVFFLTVALPDARAQAPTLPPGFTEALFAGGLNSPTAMQFAPDGRLFVCEQGGRVRVIKNGSLLPAPFLTLNVDSIGERGLLGIAFDPDFDTNNFVYVYYTARTPVHNRISRFTANGDVALAGSEVVLFDLDNLDANHHNGGALNFGTDGKLYAATGDNGISANAQSLTTVLGKILRLNTDGTIPSDNPFFTQTTGKNRAIWALGLRNPFTFAVHPIGGDLFINDVGETSWEEINDGLPGANYGWPETEGTTTDPRYESPRYAYSHAGGACAITGGAFYAPPTPQFPSDYLNDYFFADYCAGWIKRLDPAAGNSVTTFATGLFAPVDLKVGSDGSLYYLTRGEDAVYRIEFGAAGPTITSHPTSQSVAPGASVTFSVRASGTPQLRYQWQRNGTNIAGATAPDYTIAAVGAGDNGARFRARVSNDVVPAGVLSNEATLTVSSNQAPTGTITQPAAGTLYSGGMVINYAGTGTDPEDGTLPASAFTWQVDFHHDTHLHPFLPATTGSKTGSFTIPTVGETSANVWYRITLTVRDAGGLTRVTQRDVFPRKIVMTLATSPAGLQVKLDGQPMATPLAFDAVVGMQRTIEAVSPQTSGGTTYTFVSWSDGGAASHTIATPATATTYTATYQASGGGGGAIALDRVSVSGDESNVGSISWSHTSAAGTSVLVVGAVSRDATDTRRPVVGVTYAGLALTRVRQDDETVTNVYASVWYLVNPPAGAHPVIITYANAVTQASGTAATFTGVDPASPIAAHGGYTQTAGWTASASLATVAANAWVVDIQYAGADGAVSLASGQTALVNQRIAVGRSNDHMVMTAKGPITPAGPTTMGYAYSESSQVALSMIALRPGGATNQAPTGTITQPAAGTLYSGGMVINYAGTGTDPEDGTLPASAFTWQVDFHHDTHLHPFLPATTGSKTGSFTIPTVGETSANVWYRITLTVRDAGGLTRVTQRDVFPRKIVMTLATSPAGLQVKLDGQPVATPLAFDAVVGMQRTIEAVSPQTSGGTTYTFVSWSDGGAASHTIATPATATTYTATYQASGGGGGAIALDRVSVSGDESNVGSISWSHTSAAGTSVLVVGAVSRDATDTRRPVVGVTYAGLALTRVRQDDETVTNVYASVWYLVNPPAGAHPVIITYANAVTQASGTAATFTGVDPASPIAAHGGYTQTAGWTASASLATVAANAWVVDIQYAGADGAVSLASGQTALVNQAVAVGRSNDHMVMTAKGPITPAGPTTMGYAYSESSQVALSMIALRPAP